MKQSKKSILVMASAIICMLLGVAGVSWFVDPMCYYRCDELDINRSSQNVYFEAAQVIGAHRDAEVLILGSSRGETISPLWVESRLGQKTINLSKGGSGLMLKTALVGLAQKEKLPIKRIIWIADYFEFSEISTDIKVLQTPVLRDNLPENTVEKSGLSARLKTVQRLVDHNSLEASIAQLGNQVKAYSAQSGSGSDIDYLECDSAAFAGIISAEDLKKQLEVSYSDFIVPLTSKLSPEYVEHFKSMIKDLAGKGILIDIVIPPYHPQVFERFYHNHPQFIQIHGDWGKEILSLVSVPNVSVQSYLGGIPGDTNGPDYWNDGAHVSCKGMMRLLQDSALKN